jgi:hypothetical protein
MPTKSFTSGRIRMRRSYSRRSRHARCQRRLRARFR